MTRTVRVASYNLQRGIHYARIREQFRELPGLRDADVVAVQEALVPQGGRNTLARLAEDLAAGHAWSYRPVMRYPDKEYGNGFLFRPVVTPGEIRHIPLPQVARLGWLARRKTEGGVPDTKSAIVQVVEIGGARLRLVSLHLDFAGGAEHRVTQLTYLLDALDLPGDPPVDAEVLLGDFNTSGRAGVSAVEAETTRVLDAARSRRFVECSGDVAWTSELFSSIDDADPARRWLALGRALGLRYRQKLDHILVRGALPVRPAVVVDGTATGADPASDHLPLTVEIDVEGGYHRDDRGTAR